MSKNSTECKPCKKGSLIKPRYCGEPLDCIDVKKGDTYDSIMKKVNDALCNGVGNTYEFEDNEDCDVSGFKVFEVIGEDRVEIFSWCQECCTKDNFYEENIEEVVIGDTDTPFEWSFPTTGYENLSFTNTSPNTKEYIVNVSYDMIFPHNVDVEIGRSFSTWAEGAIVHTVLGSDTVLYKSINRERIQIGLYSGTTYNYSTLINSYPGSSNPYVETSDSLKLGYGITDVAFKSNTSFFKKVTLAPNETVSLKFKIIDATLDSILLQGQIFVNEL